jgi:hypothetical protein
MGGGVRNNGEIARTLLRITTGEAAASSYTWTEAG